MKKKVLKDVSINLIASFLCTAALNLVVYPLYAKKFTSVEYGDILTFIGVVNMLWAVLGNTLNNVRLVRNKEKSEEDKNGTYNLLILILALIGSVIGSILLVFFNMFKPITVILLFGTVFFGIVRVYYVVDYRLKLDYVSQLKNNCIVAAGYIVGVFIITKVIWWPLPLLLGEGIALIYTLNKGTLIREPFKWSEDCKTILWIFFDLFVTSLIGNLIAYCDRFLLHPVLGSESVAIYSTAAFWGKIVAPFIAPTANVMLSYLSQKGSRVTLKKYILMFFASVIPLMLFGVIGIWLGPFVTGILYPTLVEQALPYIAIASFGSLIAASTSLLMPILLSVCSSKKLLLIQTIYFALYVVLAFLGAYFFGLIGFCVSICIIGCIKTALYFAFGYFELRKHEKMESV